VINFKLFFVALFFISSITKGKILQSRIMNRPLITKQEFDSFYNKSTSIFSVKVESIEPTFPIDDLPQGFNKWKIKVKLLKIYKGELINKREDLISSEILIYEGPILSLPKGFWVNEYPIKDESWVIFSFKELKKPTIEEIFTSNLGFAKLLNQVETFF
jgi:hypothetical protein